MKYTAYFFCPHHKIVPTALYVIAIPMPSLESTINNVNTFGGWGTNGLHKNDGEF